MYTLLPCKVGKEKKNKKRKRKKEKSAKELKRKYTRYHVTGTILEAMVCMLNNTLHILRSHKVSDLESQPMSASFTDAERMDIL